MSLWKCYWGVNDGRCCLPCCFTIVRRLERLFLVAKGISTTGLLIIFVWEVKAMALFAFVGT